MAHSTAAVIVTYLPDREFGVRLERVSVQVGRVVIVDNGADSSVGECLKKIASRNVEVISNSRNNGLARALNQGMTRATALGCTWTLALDQDTVVDDDMVERLTEIYAHCPYPSRIGIIGSNARSLSSGRTLFRCEEGSSPYVEARTVLTSGSLLSLALYDQIGPFREDFFIEGVDLEYCLRARRYGYAILCSSRPLMTQAYGVAKEKRLFGRVVVIDDHKPWRYYLRIRNFILILRAYFWHEQVWSLGASANYLKMLVKMALYDTDRLAKARAVAHGIWDGLFGKSSPFGGEESKR